MKVSTLQLFEYFVNFPFTKIIMKKLMNHCDKDNGNRLEIALELFLKIRKDACLECKLAERAISKLIDLGGRAFGADEKEIKRRFMDLYWRRGLINVIKGLANFGVTKPFIPGAPFQVVWNITYRCNLRCKHCYAEAGASDYYELNTEEAKIGIKKLAEWGIVILAFSGGEPLIRKDILELSKYAKDNNLYVAIATNGLLLTKEKCKELKKAGVEYLQISLDGAEASTHDSFRGVQGIFDKTIEGIKNAVNEGFFVNIATTVTSHNLSEIMEIIDLCELLEVNWFMMYNFVPTGRGKNIIEIDLKPEEREELLRKLWNKLKNCKINVLSTAPQFARIALQAEGISCNMIPTHFYNPELHGQLKSLSDFIGGCGAGRFYIAINPNGDITPCVYFPLVIGNILTSSLEELWTESKELKELRNRDLLKSNCGNCNYRYVCGGCRARAYGYFKDYLAPDPGCLLNKHAYDKIRNLA